MDQNINIGTFQFDSQKLEHQIAANSLRMKEFAEANKGLNETLKNTAKNIKELEEKINSQHKIQQKLNEQKAKGLISEQQYNEEMRRSNQRLDALISEQTKQAQIQAQAVIQTNRNTQSIRELRLENNELNKLLSAGRTEIDDTSRAYKDLEVEMNALKIEAKNIGAAMEKLRQEGKENTQEYKDLEKRFSEVSGKADTLNDTIKNLDKSVGDHHRNVGNYKEAVAGLSNEIQGATSEIVGAIGQIASGNFTAGFQGLTAGISSVRTAFTSLTATMLSNPITAILVGITAVAVGIGMAVKEFFDYNNQVRELNREVEMLTNHTGEVADQIRLNATAISETYGKEFSEATKEINSLMKDFGLSADEAFAVYNKGLAQGGAMNEEFGDSIREYGVLFAQNGYSAQEFVDLLNAGIDLDIYTDKLPDAIKEAGLSLKENTKATRDALVNAFGAPFADDLLARVERGQTSVKDALAEISKKSKETHLTEQQLAQLTADVFRGAGEDAGGALKIFEAINHATELSTENMSDLEKAIIEVANSNQELATAKDEALKSDSILAFQQAWDDAWRNIKIYWYKGVKAFMDGITRTIDNISVGIITIRDKIKYIPTAFSALIKGITGDLGQLADIGKSVAHILANLFNPEALKSGLEATFNKIKNFKSKALSAIGEIEKANDKIYENAKQKVAQNREEKNKKAQDRAKAEEQIAQNSNPNAKTLKDREAEAKAQEEARKKAEAEAKKAQSEREKAVKEAQKLAEQEAKRSVELQKQKAQQSIDLAKTELAEYIRINAEKYKDDKRWTDEKLKNQTEYYNEVKRQQLAILEAEEQAKIQSIQIKIEEIQAKQKLNENDRTEIKNLLAEQNVIREQYTNERAKTEAETNDKIRADEKAKKEQDLEDAKLSRSIAFQQEILDLEAKNASEFEIKREQARQDKETELAELNEKLADKLISQENYEAQKTLIESQHAQARKEIDEAVENAKIEGFENVFGQMKSVFGEQTALGKASAIAETTISTYQSATEAYKSALKIPMVGIHLAPVMSALAVASGLKNVQKIMSVQTPKAQRGMLLQGKSHAQGGIPIMTPNGMIEAEGGEVIINKVSSHLFRDLLSDINVAGGGVKFAQGGVVGSNLSSVQNSLKAQTPKINIGTEAIEQIASAIYQGSQKGLSDLSENRRIAQGANF